MFFEMAFQCDISEIQYLKFNTAFQQISFIVAKSVSH